MTEFLNHPVSRTRIKICGITCREDALAAIAAGVDALGFVFYPPSPRALTVETAKSWIKDLPPFVTKVGLFMNPGKDQVAEAIQEIPLDLLQFHGTETPEFCNIFNKPYIKALGKGDSVQLRDAALGFTGASALLFDSHPVGEAGGTGETFDWNQMPDSINQPIILAGGLNPDNVAQAITQVRPFAVDVSSGVEFAPGRKDSVLINQFVAQVKRADSE